MHWLAVKRHKRSCDYCCCHQVRRCLTVQLNVSEEEENPPNQVLTRTSPVRFVLVTDQRVCLQFLWPRKQTEAAVVDLWPLTSDTHSHSRHAWQTVTEVFKNRSNPRFTFEFNMKTEITPEDERKSNTKCCIEVTNGSKPSWTATWWSVSVHEPSYWSDHGRNRETGQNIWTERPEIGTGLM